VGSHARTLHLASPVPHIQQRIGVVGNSVCGGPSPRTARESTRRRSSGRTMPPLKRCTYPGCAATTARPATDGWTWFQDMGVPGLPDGLYCPAHSAGIEALINDGGLDDPDNNLR